jgi:hypothetical protein
MKIGEYRVAEYGAKQLPSDKKVEKEKSEAVSGSIAPAENVLLAKNAAFVSDVKAINDTMLGIGLAENSLQKISGDKMEEAVKDLRSITASLKEMLTKSFSATNESKNDYSVEAVKSKLYGTSASNLHDFDYLGTKAATLLA